MTKIVENKETNLKLDETVLAKYADLVAVIMHRPLKQGITTTEMRRDMRIFEVIEKAKDAETFELTEEDLKFVVELAKEHAWPQGHKDILDFEDYLVSLL